MDKNKRHITEGILTLTLEIIYLLTGEDYTVVKKTSRQIVDPRSHSRTPEGWSRTQSPIMEPPPHSLIPEKTNKQKILDLTNKIIELLTGEVLVRCQDVSICLSMEEWEYLEGHKDLYKDVMMEDHQPHTSPVALCVFLTDGSSKRNPPENCSSPLYSQGSSEDDHCELQDDQGEDLIHIKVEVTAEDEIDLETDEFKNEEVNEDVNPDGSSKKILPERCPSPLYVQDHPGGNHSVPQDLQDEDLIDFKVQVIKEEACERDDRPIQEEEAPTLIGMEFKREYKDITQDSPGEHPITSALSQLYLSRIDLSSEPSNPEEPFSDQLYLDLHNSRQRERELCSCLECEKCFLLEAKKSHSKKQKFLCSDCGIYFSLKSALVQHQKIHTEEGLSSILQDQISHVAETSFHCSDCGERFTDRLFLLNHQRKHLGLKTFQCSECGKYFSLKSGLVRHQRIHTGEKPFPCYECWKFFAVKSNLVKHQRIHTGEKPFLCSECGKRFTQKTHFTKHQRTHTGEKPFSCSDCGKCFSQKPHLIKHKRIHTGEKPFICSECGRCFTSKHILLKHQRVHAS
ncbi:zinc finger protein 436-like isoform X1 [Bufo bufo]|uniref:zinc finger protein 436-like isoform X1 n=1 Tax=Bufo bufo TaxID=8384 RepID=UPI001ABDDE02|nr:zinc finger protein 436-like isoform X1 [Bufo bufo]